MKQVIYTASPESEEIHVWQLSEQGDLTLLQTVNAPGQPQPLAINARQQVLYAGVKPEFRVAAWKIGPTGMLTWLDEAPLPGSATYISTDRDGDALYIGYYHDGFVSYGALDAQGRPSEPTQVISGLEGCHSANINIENNQLYVPALKQDRICVYPLRADKSLDEASVTQIDSAKGAGPRHMAFHPQGHFAYTINELDSTVMVIALHQDGDHVVQTLATQPEDFTGTPWAADIHLTPDGKFLYTCDRTSSLLTIFAVSATGDALTLVGYHPTETQPRGFTLDKTGKFLLATGQKSHHIAVYSIDKQSGKLTDLGRHPAGKGPMWAIAHTPE
ncbi:6-phosphogluconolactonase [Rosenbergiella australiborealis]|uniref:6-phosphogluconolactonase n=1 Tax=Rosenbergiella australiborealis TaxID=1544696 RepID=A0ABS5T3U7_9GAMM|nr:6-phosphogluconolactonase [Rosenbergiella australiborealis]MBT0727027.1 6-phosphogluconolactonase [Rosenbergiella australiborealis]